jgi:UDP-glucose 4-epimerase
MRALVTGGAGFIGVHLAQVLVKNRFDVTIFDRTPVQRTVLAASPGRVVTDDLTNRKAVQEALRGVDIVYHLAWCGIPSVSCLDIRTSTSENLLSTLNLLDECRDAGVNRVVFMSSGGAIYGKAHCLRIPERHPTVPISGYGVAKLATEAYLRLYAHLYDLNYVILRPSAPFGEWQKWRRGQGAVTTFLQNAYNGSPIVLWGSQNIVRDFFYVGDLAQACLLAANMDVAPGAYNIGAGVPITLGEVIEIVRHVSGSNIPIIYKPARRVDPPSIVLDISKARRALGWLPKVSLLDGIVRTWDWVNASECRSRSATASVVPGAVGDLAGLAMELRDERNEI